MGLHAATALNRRVKSSAERAVYAGRFNIGPRLILGFVFIMLSMLTADAVVLWQFHLVRTQAERLNGIDQKLVAVLRVHSSLLAFHDRLEELADSQDVGRLVTEGGPLRTAVLQEAEGAHCSTGVLQDRGAKGAAFCHESTDVLGVREFFQPIVKGQQTGMHA